MTGFQPLLFPPAFRNSLGRRRGCCGRKGRLPQALGFSRTGTQRTTPPKFQLLVWLPFLQKCKNPFSFLQLQSLELAIQKIWGPSVDDSVGRGVNFGERVFLMDPNNSATSPWGTAPWPCGSPGGEDLTLGTQGWTGRCAPAPRCARLCGSPASAPRGCDLLRDGIINN